MFTGVYYLCTYIASLFVISMEGMILFSWLFGVVIREHTKYPFTHRHLSVVCSVFTYTSYSGRTTEYYSVTKRAQYIMTVSGQCTFVFQ